MVVEGRTFLAGTGWVGFCVWESRVGLMKGMTDAPGDFFGTFSSGKKDF